VGEQYAVLSVQYHSVMGMMEMMTGDGSWFGLFFARKSEQY
jgi:hypothetical protein